LCCKRIPAGTADRRTRSSICSNVTPSANPSAANSGAAPSANPTAANSHAAASSGTAPGDTNADTANPDTAGPDTNPDAADAHTSEPQTGGRCEENPCHTEQGYGSQSEIKQVAHRINGLPVAGYLVRNQSNRRRHGNAKQLLRLETEKSSRLCRQARIDAPVE
jgi:hypothetical protein